VTEQPGRAGRASRAGIGGRRSRTEIHNRLAIEVEDLRQRLGGLPSPLEAEGIWTDIWYSEAHHSTAIEGNTLVLREVEQLLSQGRVVGQKQLTEYLEVQGYGAAARWVYGQALAPGAWSPDALIALAEVRHIHSLTMTPVWDVAPHPHAFDGEKPGNWRQHNIQPFPGGMSPPDHPDVPMRMADWIADANAIDDDPAPIAEAVARRHAAFERIHPFLDGNGRTGRLVVNLILVRLGYPPAIVRKRDRAKYLDALTRADRGDTGPLGELLARAILDNLTRFILPAVAGPVRLVPLEALASDDLTVVALRAAAQRGRLRAIRGPGGTWRSSRQFVDAYRTSRYASLRRRTAAPGSMPPAPSDPATASAD
jgi:hypothetical protein